MSPSRRQFLATGASVLGAPFRIPAQELPPPERFTSRAGLLELDLEAGFVFTDLAGRRARCYAYNGQVPGPVLEARAGETVRVRFTNRLPEPTNVHYHGLHVDPDGFADNVFLEIDPGETLTYEFNLPPRHPASTNWYHPHLHGRTARQLAWGMAGLFLVRGELDQIPEVAAAHEHLLVLKDYGIRPDGSVSPGPLLTVSGRLNPQLRLEQGGLLRLRILNASIDSHFLIRLEEHPLHIIATEGGGLPEPIETDTLLVAPGERFDLLIHGSRPPGAYRLMSLGYDNQSGMGNMPGMAGQRPEVLATVVYEGRVERPLEVPRRLMRVEPLPPPELPVRSFEFRTLDLPSGISFLINGRTFDHERIDTRVRLNTIEDWEIVNADPMDHPIHVHTNSFQIIGRDGEPERAWKDILNVPGRSSRRFRVRYEDFIGRSVYHCHRVAHGDLGMMGVLEIEPGPLVVPPRSRAP